MTNCTASARITIPKTHCSTVRAIFVWAELIALSCSPSLLGSPFAPRFHDFLQAVAGAGIQIELVEFPELANAFERGRAEGSLAVEGVEHDAFEQVSEGHVVVIGECLEDLENSFFDAHAGLHALDFEFGIVSHVYHCTMVHK